jgi:hypothetical protein
MIRAHGTSWSTAADSTSNVFADIADNNITAYTSNGLISADGVNVLNGTAILNSSSALTMTVPTPIATTDDGKHCKIRSITAKAHTVTGQINGGSSTVTFANVGDIVDLFAYQGSWYYDTSEIGGVPGVSGYSGATGASGYSGKSGTSGYSG